VFIVIEGPNGVGKTTVAHHLARRLEGDRGLEVRVTTEPTASELGKLLRFAGEEITRYALALGIAADRMLHVEREIGPAIGSGIAVVSDRYVPSSLVLQRIDGLDLDWIWNLNRFALAPDLVVYLHTPVDVLVRRLAQRKQRSRMERIGSPDLEIRLYGEALEFLTAKGWNQVVIDCEDRDPGEIVAVILDNIDEKSCDVL